LTAAATIAALDRAAALLRECDDPDLQAVGAWLENGARGDFLSRRTVLDQRDHLLKEAASFLPAGSAREKGDWVHERLGRYRNGRWRTGDRLLRDNPHAPSCLDAILWRLLRVKDHVPSAELIRKIVG
jgi:hypothetical protein